MWQLIYQNNLMKSILLFAVIVLSYSCQTENPDTELNDAHSDASKAQLKSGVKQLITWHYSINTDHQSVLLGGQQIEYNSQGNIVKSIDYNANKDTLKTCSKTYNQQQQCTAYSCVSRDIIHTENHSYQKEKRHSSIEIVNQDTVKKVVYTYNKQGYLNIKTEQFISSNIKTSTHFLYNQQGNNIERLIYDETGQLNLKYQYQYDRLGRIIMQTIVASDAVPSYQTAQAYNPIGDLSMRASYTGQKISPQRIQYDYEYDKKNNWLLQNCRTTDGVLVKKNTRSIEY